MNNNKVVIFYSDNCAPCLQLKPLYTKILKEMGIQCDLVPVHEESGQRHAHKIGITAVPTVLYIKNGKVVHLTQGFDGSDEEKTRKNLQETLEQVF